MAVENYLELQNLENTAFEYAVLINDNIDRSLFKTSSHAYSTLC